MNGNDEVETRAVTFVLAGADHAKYFGQNETLAVLQKALDLAYLPKYRASKTLIQQLEREIRKKKKAERLARQQKQFFEA